MIDKSKYPDSDRVQYRPEKRSACKPSLSPHCEPRWSGNPVSDCSGKWPKGGFEPTVPSRRNWLCTGLDRTGKWKKCFWFKRNIFTIACDRCKYEKWNAIYFVRVGIVSDIYQIVSKGLFKRLKRVSLSKTWKLILEQKCFKITLKIGKIKETF